MIKKWKRWVLPTKIGVIGSFASVISLLVIFLPNNQEESASEVINKLNEMDTHIIELKKQSRYFVELNSKTENITIKKNIFSIDSFQNKTCDSVHYTDQGEPIYSASSTIETTLEYPSVIGIKNKELENKINNKFLNVANVDPGLINTAPTAHTEKDTLSTIGNYDITYRYNEFVGISFQLRYMECGMPNSTEFESSINLNLQTGEEYELKDLFKYDYTEKTVPILEKNISQNSRFGYQGQKLRNQEFFFTKDYLYVSSPNHPLGVWNYQEYGFTIPLSELVDFINPHGPLAFYLKTKS